MARRRPTDAITGRTGIDKPGAATVVATGEAVLSGHATARQLLDALTVLAGELSTAAPAADTEDPTHCLPDHDTSQPRAAPVATSTATPVAPQQTSAGPTRTLSSNALRSGSYEDAEPYVNLADETTSDAESDAIEES
jgi:hypothetical protein